MRQTEYLTIKEVTQLQELLIKRFGGSPGIRDLGLLASAVARPQTGYYDTLCEQAVAIAQSLVLNHAFVDGNKRIGALCMIVFLAMNGQKMSALSEELVSFVVDQIILGKKSVKELARWLESRVKPSD